MDIPFNDAEQQQLCQLAQEARDQAYAPYSHHPVGAVLRTDNGQIFSGCNVENAAHPLGQCAEASAIGAMIRAGERHITDVFVVGPGPQICTPCGGCRQKLWEFSDTNTRVHLCVGDRVERVITLGELLPAAFGRADVQRDSSES